MPPTVELLRDGEDITTLNLDLGQEVKISAKKSGYGTGPISWQVSGAIESIIAAETGGGEVIVVGQQPGRATLSVIMQATNGDVVTDSVIIQVSDTISTDPGTNFRSFEIQYQGKNITSLAMDLQQEITLTVQKVGVGTGVLTWNWENSSKLIVAQTGDSEVTLISKEPGMVTLTASVSYKGETIRDSVIITISEQVSPDVLDTDGDGILDVNDNDIDNDGIINMYDDNPKDKAGLGRGFDYKNDITNSGWKDTDNDGLHDDFERLIGTFPDRADSDYDGFEDGYELKRGTDPLDSDSNPNNSSGSLSIPGSVKISTERYVWITPEVPSMYSGNLEWIIEKGSLDDIDIVQVGDSVKIQAYRQDIEAQLVVRVTNDHEVFSRTVVYSVSDNDIIANVSKDGKKAIHVPQRLSLVVGETVSFNPIISGVQDLSLSGFNTSIADVQYDRTSNLLSITGAGVGELTITLAHKEYRDVQALIKINVYSANASMQRDPIFVVPGEWVTESPTQKIKPIILFTDTTTFDIKTIYDEGMKYEYTPESGTVTFRSSNSGDTIMVGMDLDGLYRELFISRAFYREPNNNNGFNGNPENEFHINSFANMRIGDVKTFILDPKDFTLDCATIKWSYTLTPYSENGQDSQGNPIVWSSFDTVSPEKRFMTLHQNGLDTRIEALRSQEFRIRGELLDSQGLPVNPVLPMGYIQIDPNHEVRDIIIKNSQGHFIADKSKIKVDPNTDKEVQDKNKDKYGDGDIPIFGDHTIGWIFIDGSVQSISFDRASVDDLKPYDATTLSVIFNPQETDQKRVLWEVVSSGYEPGIITLAENYGESNIVVAQKPGHARIKISAVDNGDIVLKNKMGEEVVSYINVFVRDVVTGIRLYKTHDDFGNNSDLAMYNRVNPNEEIIINDAMKFQIRIDAASGEEGLYKAQIKGFGNTIFDVSYQENDVNKFTLTPSKTDGGVLFKVYIDQHSTSFYAVSNPEAWQITTSSGEDTKYVEDVTVGTRLDLGMKVREEFIDEVAESDLDPSRVSWRIISDNVNRNIASFMGAYEQTKETKIEFANPGLAVVQVLVDGSRVQTERYFRVGVPMPGKVAKGINETMQSNAASRLEEYEGAAESLLDIDSRHLRDRARLASVFHLDSESQTYLPQHFVGVTKLDLGGKKLDLSVSGATDFLKYCKDLQYLDISHSKLQSLDVRRLDKLVYLDVSTNLLTHLNVNYRNLSYLDVSENRDFFLSSDVQNLGSSVPLTIQDTEGVYALIDNQLVRREENRIVAWKNSGDIFGNSWDSPVTWNSSKSVVPGAVLKANDIKQIGTSVTTLGKKLLGFDVSNVEMDSNEINWNGRNGNVVKAHYVKASSSGLKKIDFGEGVDLVSLRVLDLSNNQIRTAQTNFNWKFSNLRSLDVSNNEIGLKFGGEIGNREGELKKLKENYSGGTSGKSFKHQLYQGIWDIKDHNQWPIMTYTLTAKNAGSIYINNNYIRSGLEEGYISGFALNGYHTYFDLDLFTIDNEKTIYVINRKGEEEKRNIPAVSGNKRVVAWILGNKKGKIGWSENVFEKSYPNFWKNQNWGTLTITSKDDTDVNISNNSIGSNITKNTSTFDRSENTLTVFWLSQWWGEWSSGWSKNLMVTSKDSDGGKKVTRGSGIWVKDYGVNEESKIGEAYPEFQDKVREQWKTLHDLITSYNIW